MAEKYALYYQRSLQHGLVYGSEMCSMLPAFIATWFSLWKRTVLYITSILYHMDQFVADECVQYYHMVQFIAETCAFYY